MCGDVTLLALAGDILNAKHDKWQKCLDVDLTAVMVGTRLAVHCMQAKRNPGTPTYIVKRSLDGCAHVQLIFGSACC